MWPQAAIGCKAKRSSLVRYRVSIHQYELCPKTFSGATA